MSAEDHRPRAATALAARLPPLLAIAALMMAALTYHGIFSNRLSAVPAINYAERDDAIITLSHARNLVEYGFIGVSPSGERVEGFSAPLQFWAAAAAYRIRPFDFQTFFRWQLRIGSMLLGIMVVALLVSGCSTRRPWTWYAFALLAAGATAEILSQSRAFLLWHASGMENVYKNVALLALLWTLDRMLRTARIRYAAVAVVFLASITRIDAIVPVGVLLAVFVVLWTWRHRTRHGAVFALASLLPWAAYMTWRVWYFGSWMPNTGMAQRISIGDRISFALSSPLAAISDYEVWLTTVGASLHADQFFWLPILAFCLRRHRGAVDRSALLVAGGLACVAQYALFGPARMDNARTVSELAIYAALVVPWLLTAKDNWQTRDSLIGAAMIVISLAAIETRPYDRIEIGYPQEAFAVTAERTSAIAAGHDLPRPSLANPDLGVVSWAKEFNVVDLGALGSTAISRVHNPARYLAEVAKPDIIEIHDWWSCRYRALFENPQFVEEYEAVSSTRTPWLDGSCRSAPHALTGYWVRRAIMKDSGSTERVFLDAFRKTLDLGLVRRELDRCLAGSDDRPCGDVGRVLFRFVPELKQRQQFDDVAAMLAGDPRLAVERAYFTSSVESSRLDDVVAWSNRR